MADRMTTEELKKLLQLSKAAPEQPWTIRQCYEMGGGDYHWAIENEESNRNGCVIGLEGIFQDHWARPRGEVQFPDTPIISYLLSAVNSAPSLARELIELRERDRWIPYSHEAGDDHLCGNAWLVRCYWIGDPNGGQPVGYNADDDNEPFTDVASYSHQSGWCVGSDGSQDVAVTHYMALPCPPSETGKQKGTS